MEFLSLHIHDIFPEGFNEQGIYEDGPIISRYTLFFREDDPISIAWKKWLDFIIDDYIFFWNVISNKIKFGELQDDDFIKLHDLFEIITFINPQAIRVILNEPKLFELLKMIRLKPLTGKTTCNQDMLHIMHGCYMDGDLCILIYQATTQVTFYHHLN